MPRSAFHDEALVKFFDEGYRNSVLNRYLAEPNVARRVLIVLAVTYAALAGLRTVGEFDLGWQIATGRWIVENHSIPSGDVLTHTIAGQRWVYPALGQVIFYFLDRFGGMNAISWFSMLACLATVAVLIWQARAVTAFLAIVAVPMIVFRTSPRAELFTTILFSFFLVLIWRQQRGQQVPLWLFPLLMLLWVNLHLGFIAGLALWMAAAGVTIGDGFLNKDRAAILSQLRFLAKGLAACLVVTVINPWGWRLYASIGYQAHINEQMRDFLAEWVGVRLTWAAASVLFDWRNPESSYWWLLIAACLAIVVTLALKRLGTAFLLLVAIYASITHLRYHGLFACIVVAVAGPALADGFDRWMAAREQLRPRLHPAIIAGALMALALVCVRAFDLVSNRYYFQSGQISTFGTGASWWYDEGAVQYLAQHPLRGEMFNDFNSGGFLAWRLGLARKTFIDSRAIPFGERFLWEQRQLMQEAPDSKVWAAAADRYKINFIVLPVGRFVGLGTFPLDEFCRSTEWRPLFLDSTGTIFVRNRPENEPLVSQANLDCKTVQFVVPTDCGRPSLYNFYLNSASVYFVLGRDTDAMAMIRQAEALFADDPHLYLLRGQLREANGDVRSAEAEYRRAVSLSPVAVSWQALSQNLAAQHRWEEAAVAMRQAAERSYHPAGLYFALGRLQTRAGDRSNAIASLQQALAWADELPPQQRSQFNDQVHSLLGTIE